MPSIIFPLNPVKTQCVLYSRPVKSRWTGGSICPRCNWRCPTVNVLFCDLKAERPRRHRGATTFGVNAGSDFLLFQKFRCILSWLSDKREINDGARAEHSQNAAGRRLHPTENAQNQKEYLWKCLEILGNRISPIQSNQGVDRASATASCNFELIFAICAGFPWRGGPRSAVIGAPAWTPTLRR
jgi:hypothetical protein